MADLHIHLSAWREHFHLTQEQVASALGIVKSTVSRWETGRTKVDIQDLGRLAHLYGVDPVALFLAPDDIGTAERLTEARRIITAMAPDAAADWLALGARLAPRSA